jgi:hypothetical protein
MGANAQTSVPVFTSGQVLTAQQQTEINTGIPVFAIVRRVTRRLVARVKRRLPKVSLRFLRTQTRHSIMTGQLGRRLAVLAV